MVDSEIAGSDPRVATESSPVLRIAIAGAAGFVGEALAARLAKEAQVIALGRRYPRAEPTPTPESAAAQNGRRVGIRRKRCDLFSVRQTEKALEGVDIAIYLVHSMSPNARLQQGSFQDLDLLLADNFARAANHAGVKRIVYLGGLLPPAGTKLSPHLESRFEVEKTLGSTEIPVTAVRAGLVVGAEGSSLNLLVHLVERLPIMVCPSWTSSRTQPIALRDVIEILVHCCHDEETTGRVCDVGGPDVLSYREMMQETARILGRRRPMIPVPLVTPALSELWVSIVTGSSRKLVRPLIESLRHPMIAEDRWVQKKMNLEGTSFEDALRDSLRHSRIYKKSAVRSVQRLPCPKGRSAKWVGEEYPRWLKKILPGFITADVDEQGIRLGVFFIEKPLLVLSRRPDRSDPSRFLLGVDGGLLAGKEPSGDPRLEFRSTLDGAFVVAALQDFEPRLPWWFYAMTQAPLHASIMWAYRRYMQGLADEAPSPPAAA
ncbi:MAG: NAD(P)H-binding protein [Myxococcota bacterium]